jgi:hypothetical protein
MADPTWSPRVGASGDDRFNVPESTYLDGTKASGPGTKILAYPTTSTGHLTQVVTEIIARFTAYNSGRGASYPTFPGGGPGTTNRILANKWLTARDQVDLIRSLEDRAAYGWSADWPAVGAPTRILGKYVAQLRQGLSRARGTLTPAASKQYYRTDNPYGTLLSESYSPDFNYRIGKTWRFMHDYSKRYRQIRKYTGLLGYDLSLSAKLLLKIASTAVDLETFTLECYLVDGDTDFYNFDNLLGSITSGGIVQDGNYFKNELNLSGLPDDQDTVYLLLVTNHDRLDDGLDPNDYDASSMVGEENIEATLACNLWLVPNDA